jgi:hypothetical protein
MTAIARMANMTAASFIGAPADRVLHSGLMELDPTPDELATLEKLRAELMFDTLEEVVRHLILVEGMLLSERKVFPYKLFEVGP